MIFSGHTEKLPAQTIGQRQSTRNLPVVTRVSCVLFPPYRVRITQLIYLAGLRRQSQQKVGPAMKELAVGQTGRVTLLTGGSTAKAECAAHRLERAALRLKMV